MNIEKLRELRAFCAEDETRKELWKKAAIAALELIRLQGEIALKRLKREPVGVKDEQELFAATHAFAAAKQHLLDACQGFNTAFDENDVFRLFV